MPSNRVIGSPPASFTVTAQSPAAIAHRATAIAAGGGRADGQAAPGQRVSDRRLVAGADVHPRRASNILAPPAITASSRRTTAPDRCTSGRSARARRGRRTCRLRRSVPLDSGSTTWASPATPATRSIERQPDARAQAARDELIAGALEATASSPMRDRAHPIMRPPRARAARAARRRRRRSAAAGTRSSTARSATCELGVQHEHQLGVVGRLAAQRRDDRAEHVGRQLRRAGLQVEAGHRRQRVQVGGAEDVADLAQRRLADLGARPRRPAACRASRRRAGR